MKFKILVILVFFSSLINAQTIGFINEQKIPIENVYLEFKIDGVNKKYSSDAGSSIN